MDYNRPALLVLLVLYFIFLTIAMSWYGDMLFDFGIDSEYKVIGTPVADDVINNTLLVDSSNNGVSFLKSLRIGVSNMPVYLNIIFFILPSIMLILVFASFFTAD